MTCSEYFSTYSRLLLVYLCNRFNLRLCVCVCVRIYTRTYTYPWYGSLWCCRCNCRGNPLTISFKLAINECIVLLVGKCRCKFQLIYELRYRIEAPDHRIVSKMDDCVATFASVAFLCTRGRLLRLSFGPFPLLPLLIRRLVWCWRVRVFWTPLGEMLFDWYTQTRPSICSTCTLKVCDSI